MRLQDMRVLVSDNSVTMRRRLKSIVEDMGFGTVIEAKDGQEAIDLYKMYKPQIVFMDSIMPGKTGVQAIEEIIAYDKEANIIIVSPTGTKQTVQEAIRAGAKEFLKKPMVQNHVQEVVSHYMN